jgi:hypothetical protein
LDFQIEYLFNLITKKRTTTARNTTTGKNRRLGILSKFKNKNTQKKRIPEILQSILKGL